MLSYLFYILILIFELEFFFSFSVYVVFLIYSHLKGSPFVPSKMKEIKAILAKSNLKKGMRFYDLGWGDGRVVREAVKHYHVTGYGIDVNPLLIVTGRIMAKLKSLKNITFSIKNIFDVDLGSADVIYLFLMPALLKKLSHKIATEIKPKTLIVSHGFKIEGWEKYLTKTIDHLPFPTYFYKLK